MHALMLHTHWRMYQTLVGTGLFCVMLIVAVFSYTQPIIEHKKTQARNKAIFTLLPQAMTYKTYQLEQNDRFTISETPSATGNTVYVGYDASNRIVGFVIAASGMGYQDTIELLYAYAPARQAIIGLIVLSNRETPGLGSKIETDAAFLENFTNLDVSLNTSQTDLLHPIQSVKSGRKQNAWQIDGISGATVSCQAVGNIVQNSASRLLPIIAQQLITTNYN